MTNLLEGRWNGLTKDSLRPVFQLFDAAHPLDFYIGRDTDGARLMLLVTPEVPPAIRDMREISIRRFKREDDKWSILLRLESLPLAPMFSMLCEDILESSRAISGGSPLSFVLRRLSNWRRLFERGLPNLLSENEIRGLCGELLFLQRLFIRSGKFDAVKAWVGPEQSEQDFQVPEAAWEIKTIRPSGQAVSISSESQLQTTLRPVDLIVVELAECTVDSQGAFSLNTLVENLRSDLADDHDARELFEERLVSAGYVTRSEYDVPTLFERSLSAFAVKVGFPRITGEEVKSGVAHVRYDVALSACEPFRIAPYPHLARKE